LSSCCLNSRAKIRSNYCYLYTPFPKNLSLDIINYLHEFNKSIKSKEVNNKAITLEEKTLSIFIKYAGRNDQVYYLKGCDKNVG